MFVIDKNSFKSITLYHQQNNKWYQTRQISNFFRFLSYAMLAPPPHQN